jgi:DNA-binding IclR family transcriptional regulator
MTGRDGVYDEKIVGSDRVLALLIELAQHPEGASLEDLAATQGGSKSTVHRALGSLVRSRLADQTGRGQYVLGDEFIRLAFRHQSTRPETARIEPVLRELSTMFGETAHYAVLDGRDVVYRAKTDPEVGAVRLSSTIGGRNPAPNTAVGKMLLSGLLTTTEDLVRWLDGSMIEKRTVHSITSIDDFIEELRLTRERGYALDDQENELGVNCLAVPVRLDGSTTPSGAISVSALTFRHPLTRLVESYDAIVGTIERTLGTGSVRPTS